MRSAMQVVLLGGALGAAVTVSSGRDRDIAYSRCKYGKNWGKVLHDVCFSANHETVASANGSQLLKFLHYVRVGAIHDTLPVFLQKPANHIAAHTPESNHSYLHIESSWRSVETNESVLLVSLSRCLFRWTPSWNAMRATIEFDDNRRLVDCAGSETTHFRANGATVCDVEDKSAHTS